LSHRRQHIGDGIVVRLEQSVGTPGLTPFIAERIELVTAVPEFWQALGYVETPTHHMVKVMR
jgi:hypothetical protein